MRFCGDVCCLFRRRLAQSWAGILYLRSPEIERGLRSLLASHSIEVVDLAEEEELSDPVVAR